LFDASFDIDGSGSKTLRTGVLVGALLQGVAKSAAVPTRG
jgi:hypothetical protein